MEVDAERLEIGSMDLRVPLRLTRISSSRVATSVRCYGLPRLLYFISTLLQTRRGEFEACSNGVLSLPFSLLKELGINVVIQKVRENVSHPVNRLTLIALPSLLRSL